MRRTSKSVDRTAFNSLKGLVHRAKPLGEPLGHVLAARAALDEALASLGFPRYRHPEDKIIVSSLADGCMIFNVLRIPGQGERVSGVKPNSVPG